MQTAPRGLSAYNRVASMEPDPLQQIVMLYQDAMKFLRMAAADIDAADFAAKAEHSGRALDIISYLQSILDFERGQDVARVLDHFYSSVTALVLKASMTPDAALMRRAADLLAPVSEAWAINASAGVAGAARNAATLMKR